MDYAHTPDMLLYCTSTQPAIIFIYHLGILLVAAQLQIQLLYIYHLIFSFEYGFVGCLTSKMLSGWYKRAYLKFLMWYNTAQIQTGLRWMATSTAKKSRVFSKKGTLLFLLIYIIIKFLEQFMAKLLSAYFPFSRLVRSILCVCAPASPFNLLIFTNFAMTVMLLEATINATLFKSQ